MKNKSLQLTLFKKDLRFHGGRLLLGKRKSLRPLSTKDPIHLVPRSSWAKGRWSFLRPQNKPAIAYMIKALSEKYGVRIYRTAIQSNHLHLVLKIESRRTYKAFIRVLSAKIAVHVMKQETFEAFRKTLSPSRGYGPEPQGKGQKFWQFRPFTRVLNWGKDFQRCCGYVIQNILEATGFVPYRERKLPYKLSQKPEPVHSQ
ncbi:MAG: transposase [Bdellovibrionales bacterium]|nr:transposase [Bdellovibrionales bacterium]